MARLRMLTTVGHRSEGYVYSNVPENLAIDLVKRGEAIALPEPTEKAVTERTETRDEP